MNNRNDNKDDTNYITNERNDKNDDINKQKILQAFNSKLKLHLTLQNRVWRNGFVKEVNADFFIFDDYINGEEPIFFLELRRIEPYLKEEKE